MLDDMPRSNRHRTALVFALLLVAVTAVRVTLLDRPFLVNSEGLSTGWVLSSARNYVRYGPAGSRFAGILNSGDVPRDQWIIYSHHPPATPMLTAAAMAVGGVSERTGRIVPAVFSIATTVLLFAFVRRRYGLRAAAVTGVVYAFCPMTLALGDMAEYLNAPLVFCGVAMVGAYVRWIETGRRVWIAALSALFLLGALSDWPIFYLVPILSAHALLTRRARFIPVVLLAGAAAAIFAVLAAWVLWSGGDVSVFHQLSVRASARRITLADWVARVIIHHQGRLHTWPVLVLSALYVVQTARRRLTGRWPNVDAHLFPLLLLAWGLTNLFIGIDGNYRHEWWSLVLTPALAVTAALGVEHVIRVLPPWGRRRAAAVPLAAAAVLLFAALSAFNAHGFRARTWLRDSGYTLQEIGTAIGQVATEREGVLTSVDTTHGALWFYADRQIRPGVTSVAMLDAALGAGPYRLFSRYVQPGGPAPTWFVLPAAHRLTFPELAAVLDARYPSRPVAGATAYRLRD